MEYLVMLHVLVAVVENIKIVMADKYCGPMVKWYVVVISIFITVFSGNARTRLGADGALELPSLPPHLRQPVDRADYVVRHFWDAMDWTDTLLGHNQSWLEQQLVNYLSVLPHAHPDSVARSIDAFMTSAQSDVVSYESLDQLATQYLFNTDSPMHNDEYFIMFLKNKVKAPILSDVTRQRAAWMLEELGKNRVGHIAADFSFSTVDGRKVSLSEIRTDKDILLIFYDPDCSSCHDAMSALKSNPLDVTVVAICVEGERDAWLADARVMPSHWIVGYPDTAIDELYALFEMPTMLLLSPDRIVRQTAVQLKK